MNKKRLLIITDAWKPQVNGVVETLERTIEECSKKGIYVDVIHPNSFKTTFPCPSYPSIRLAFPSKKTIQQRLSLHKPDYIHIATEGPIGLRASKILKQKRIPYTTSYHTRFPEYLCIRIPFLKARYVYSFLYNNIHKNASSILVTTQSMKETLAKNGFNDKKLKVWGRGIDIEKYRWKEYDNLGRILLYVGRISPEKNIDEMLDNIILTPFKIKIVGDGPSLKKLKSKYERYENIQFLGEKRDEALVREYHSSDIFVFPSKTDTFGIVQLEAMACGLPVAAYEVTGPKDIITKEVNGFFSENLHTSIHQCSKIDSKKCSLSVQHLTWESVTDIFIDTLKQIDSGHWY